jgi:hypothetical protein
MTQSNFEVDIRFGDDHVILMNTLMLSLDYSDFVFAAPVVLT